MSKTKLVFTQKSEMYRHNGSQEQQWKYEAATL